MCEDETHTHTHILEETSTSLCLNFHRSTFLLWPISRNLILYVFSRGHYITVVHGCRMNIELNPLAISPPASSLFLAGHLMGAESYVHFTFLWWHLPTEWVMKKINFKCLFSLPSYLLLLFIVYLSQSVFLL